MHDACSVMGLASLSLGDGGSALSSLTQDAPHSLTDRKDASSSSSTAIQSLQSNQSIAARQARSPSRHSPPPQNGKIRVLDIDLHQLEKQALASLLQWPHLRLDEGLSIHAHLVERGADLDTFLANVLLSMYRRLGDVDDARTLFERMHTRSVVTWNTMIALSSELGLRADGAAHVLFKQMQKDSVEPNQITLICALTACTDLADGKTIHKYIRTHVDSPKVTLSNALISMYGKCGALHDAREVFDNLSSPHVVSWNSMISAYSSNGNGKKAISLFWEMQKAGVQPNSVTLICVIGACAVSGALSEGYSIHAYAVDYGFDSNVVVGNALISMYCKCQEYEDAYTVFMRLPRWSIVSWNAAITMCAEQGQSNKALQLFQEMKQQGVTPNEVTFRSTLSACSVPEALEAGKMIHEEIQSSEFKFHDVINNALINMYGKCGAPQNARSVFDNMEQHNVVSWSTIIGAFAENGHCKEALQLFQEMRQVGIMPNDVTFLCLLSVCCHAGLLEEGQNFFTSMVDDYGITPNLKHYSCMIDLLGRAGQLQKAEDMIQEMPFQPDIQVWMALLSACSKHKDVSRAKQVAEAIFDLIPHDTAAYVQLSNIYAADERWEDVDKVREAMNLTGVKQLAGCSWIEIEDTVHEFVVGDTSHPKLAAIYAELERINEQAIASGFAPDKPLAQQDMEHKVEEHQQCGHSEKLAIAFGLISTPSKSPLRVTKNLRTCLECHTAAKYMSELVEREIFIKDPSQSHHFQGGVCSCDDKW